jgi:hypothetical protein
MEISDANGRTVAVLSVDDATDAISWRLGDADAVRCVAALVQSVCCEAGESGQKCPDAVLIDFRRYLRSYSF